MAHDPAHDAIAQANREMKALAIAIRCWQNGPEPFQVSRTTRGAQLAVERAAGIRRSSKSSDETWALAQRMFDEHRLQYGEPPWARGRQPEVSSSGR